ncbi:MAG TPA: hypothetical protein VIF12_06580, partial [Micavibrio sp.]
DRTPGELLDEYIFMDIYNRAVGRAHPCAPTLSRPIGTPFRVYYAQHPEQAQIDARIKAALIP